MELNKCLGCMENYQGSPCPVCGYDPSQAKSMEYTLPPQTILAGKYLVGRVLGQGGFGITYIGWDIALERKVAIKEYYPNGLVGRSQTSRTQLVWYSGPLAKQAQKEGMNAFLREARKMTKVSAIPRVVQVRDLFYENETAYIVMDFVEGRTLKKQLEAKGPMTWNQLKPILLPAAQAMEQVHQAGLIHRDLSPDNLMLTPDGDVRILDLGAAKDLKKGSGVSSMQVAKGGFSPPEQYFQQGSSGPYTDVYALAATAYYALTGKVPIPAIDRMNKDSLRWDLPELAGAPENVVHALRKAMSLRSQDRPQTMGEFAALLTQKGHTLKKGLPKPAIIGLSAIAAVCLIVGTVGLLGGTKKSTPKVGSSAVSTSLPTNSAETDGVYRLSQAADLELLRSHPEGKFVLTGDIDLSGVSFEAVHSFSGTLDGNGYWIRGLTTDTKTAGDSILFETIAAEAQIKDLGLEIRVSATGANQPQIDGLCNSNQGTISGCTVNSTISGLRSYSPIAASNTGTVSNCKTATESESCQSVRGILGSNKGTVKECQVTITAKNGGVEALIDRNYSGSVELCYAAVTVESCHFFDGLASQNYAPFKNCTVSGQIASTREDDFYWNGTANEGYGSEILNCSLSVTDKRTGKTLPIAPSYVEASEETAPATDTSPGSGTLADPYKISSTADLEKLRTDSKSRFVLTKNLDLSGAAFTPIQEFSGTLDGGGYTISGLNPSFNKGESYWNGALFFKLTKNAVVKNLGVKCSLTTSKEKSNGAGIAVSNEGLIQNCTVEIKARGCYALGGITQNNVYCGTIQDCTVTIVAQDCKFVGGIGEYQAGAIRGCQAKIELTDSTSIGGIAYANAGTVENCTASGIVTTKYTNGVLAGVVGENISGGQVSNCTSSVTSSGTSLPAIG